MLFDTWADCLCQTWRGALFTVTVPWNGSSRKSSGRKKQREGMNSSLIPEMSVWRSCSTSINLFFISPRRSQEGGPWEVHLATRGSSSAAPWGKRRSVSVCFSCSHEGHKWQKLFFFHLNCRYNVDTRSSNLSKHVSHLKLELQWYPVSGNVGLGKLPRGVGEEWGAGIRGWVQNWIRDENRARWLRPGAVHFYNDLFQFETSRFKLKRPDY